MPRNPLRNAPSPSPSPCRPSGRTLDEFGELTIAERKLIDCCRTGDEAVLGEVRPKRRNKGNEVRASLIRFLALGGDSRTPVHEYGVAVRGAWISGPVAIEDAVVPHALSLRDCRIERFTAWRTSIPIIILDGSRLTGGLEGESIRTSFGLSMYAVTADRTIDLRGARLGGDLILDSADLSAGKDSQNALDLELAKIEGSVLLGGARSNGTVSSDGAAVRGDFRCSGATLSSKSDWALHLDGADIGRNLFLRDGFRAAGGARLLGTRIGLALDCSDATFEGGPDAALECERAVVSGTAHLLRSRFVGPVSFHGASIGRSLLCQGAQLSHPAGISLDCSSAAILGKVELSDGFSATGQVCFIGAEIKGNLRCSKSQLIEESTAAALVLDDSSIGLSVILEDEFRCSGAVLLRGTTIGRNFEIRGATLETEADFLAALDYELDPMTESTDFGALCIARGTVSGSVLIDQNCRVKGMAILFGTTIGGSLQCQGTFENEGLPSLICRRCNIAGNVRLRDGFRSTGSVSFWGTRVGGDMDCEFAILEDAETALDCENGRIAGNLTLDRVRADGEVNLRNVTIGKSVYCRGSHFNGSERALTLELAEIGGGLFFEGVGSVAGAVNLSSLQAGKLCDDLASWSGASGRLRLDGFIYDRLGARAPTDSRSRVQWLEHQDPDHLKGEFRPQPWEQLIATLRVSGHPNQARAVAIAKNDRMRRAGKIVKGTGSLHWLYGALVGYGYRPARLLGAVIVVWLGCAFAYGLAVSAPKPFLIPAPDQKELRSSFSPVFYSLDVLLPVVDLGYSDKWVPAVNATLANGREDQSVTRKARNLRMLRWIEIIVGWIFGGVLAAMLTQIVKKD